MHAKNPKWMPILLLLGGVLSIEWHVDYKQKNICAVKGSSVIIPCSFKYPEKETVQSVKWSHERSNAYMGPFLYDSQQKNNSSTQFQYIGDKTDNCSFKILHLQQYDAGKYFFRFITNSPEGQWTGLDGSTLKIVDLDVLTTNEDLREGDSVNLTCVYSCDGERPSEVTWFKDGKPIYEGQRLHLGNTSSTVSGNYSCSLTEHKGTASGIKHVSIQHGPKNTSASVTPSPEVKTGSNVTLICSSYANPPVENYTWFRMSRSKTQTVGHEPEHHIMEVLQSHQGQYFCTATNKHGSQNSSVVTLKLQELQTTFSINKLIIAFSVTALLAVIIFVLIRRSCKKRTKPAESEPEVDTQNSIYANWENKEPTQEENQLIYATVTAKKTTDRGKQMDPSDDDGCVIYSTVCRT